ncbi:hypothetical protein BOTCAL_0006g00370 [Botryotinia calthae]|uniref:Uncharacterized protein n=1 Tax=Botryotinia calthae TaxID=38488 RepID=A0A4Y8DHC5_9HELO|nr:hypothetical protein BOTCAL_0006g00370 [Botryotinia calthae]
MFEPGCPSLTLSNAYTTSLDIPPELRHFFGLVIINPVTALNNLTRVFIIDDAPYIIQVTPQHKQGGLIRLKTPKFFIPKPPNDEPDGPNQFLRSSLNQDKGVIEKQMLESSGFSEGVPLLRNAETDHMNIDRACFAITRVSGDVDQLRYLSQAFIETSNHDSRFPNGK